MCPVYIWRCPIIPEFSLSLCNRQSPRHEGGANDNVDMEENPAYDDLKMKDESPSREVAMEDVRYTTSGDPTGQQAYEEIVYRN
jgi:hypothetical protein